MEFAGSAITDLSMEGRMTLCNMAIEAGARAGLVAPDQSTYDYLEGREFAPKGDHWEQAVAHWESMKTDEGADLMKLSNFVLKISLHKYLGEHLQSKLSQ